MIPSECGVLERPPSSGHIVGNGRSVVARRSREARPFRGPVHCGIAENRANSLSVGTLKRSMILLAEMDNLPQCGPGAGALSETPPHLGLTAPGRCPPDKLGLGPIRWKSIFRANRPSDLTSDRRGLIRGMVLTDRLKR